MVLHQLRELIPGHSSFTKGLLLVATQLLVIIDWCHWCLRFRCQDSHIIMLYHVVTSVTQDSSGGVSTPKRSLELTSENCTWRTMARDSGEQKWNVVQEPSLLFLGDVG